MILSSRIRDTRGASLVESMVAFVLMAGVAAAVFPVFSRTKIESKKGDVRQLCENIVRGKLDEYRLGRPLLVSDAETSVGDYVNLPAMSWLSNLTYPTLSSTTVNGVGNSTTTQNQAVGGFFYSKVRYNRFFPYSCKGTTAAQILSVLGTAAPGGGTMNPTLGMRECVGSNQVLNVATTQADPTTSNGCATTIDGYVQREMPGFKLYVRLELDTPWPLPDPTSLRTTTGNPANDAQFGVRAALSAGPGPSCPDFGSYGPTPLAGSLYDFDGAGDSILVTVTGVVDFPSLNIQQFAGLLPTDFTRFVCSASAVVQSDPPPVRYYLNSDGKIYGIHGHGINGSEGGTWALQSIYTQGTLASNGIRSFAVHPRDLSVYVLRPGSITRYGACGGVPLDCSLDTTMSNGLSDSGQSGWPNVQEWSVMSSIRSLAVDFKSGIVYGLSGDRSQVYEILNSDGTTLAQCGAGCAVGQGATATVTPAATLLTSLGINLSGMLTASNRLVGFFAAPSGDEFFVSDLMSRSTSLGATSYASTIYRASGSTNANQTYPVATLPVAATAFSK